MSICDSVHTFTLNKKGICNLSHYVLLLTLIVYDKNTANIVNSFLAYDENTANIFVRMVDIHIEGMIPITNFKKGIDNNNEDNSMRLS